MLRQKQKQGTCGLLLYSNIQDVILTQTNLQKAGVSAVLVPPPSNIAMGCDLSVQFKLIELEAIKSLQDKGKIFPGKIHYVHTPLPEIENLTRVVELEGGYLMAVSNNVKVTAELATGEIVNLSGGGCPDIPYVAQHLVGRLLTNCPEPVELGTTLCTYMVQLAVNRLRQEV